MLICILRFKKLKFEAAVCVIEQQYANRHKAMWFNYIDNLKQWNLNCKNALLYPSYLFKAALKSTSILRLIVSALHMGLFLRVTCLFPVLFQL